MEDQNQLIKLGICCFFNIFVEKKWMMILKRLNNLINHIWSTPTEIIYCGSPEYESKVKEWAETWLFCKYKMVGVLISPRSNKRNGLSFRYGKRISPRDNYINSDKRSNSSNNLEFLSSGSSEDDRFLSSGSSEDEKSVSPRRKRSPKSSPRKIFKEILDSSTHVIIFDENSTCVTLYSMFQKANINVTMISYQI